MQKTFFFIDECGDPEFYGKRKKLLLGQPGFQPILFLGMITTENRKSLQSVVIEFSKEIRKDKLFRSIPSVNKPGWFLHAKDDHPEVRAEFFKLLRKQVGIRFHAVIARKDLDIFQKKHNSNPSEFYFDVVKHLIEPHLNPENLHGIYLSHRPKTTADKLTVAIDKAILSSQKKLGSSEPITYDSTIEKCSFMPELSVVDYFLWALQRYIYKKESRFWEAIEPLVGSVTDLYDENTVYNQSNAFSLEKAKVFPRIL
jgi:hypothetical protein